MSDHLHMLISILPKYSVAQIVGFVKGNSAIHFAPNYMGRRNYTGQQFWYWSYRESTAGHDEEAIHLYTRSREQQDQRLDQLALVKQSSATSGAAIVHID